MELEFNKSIIEKTINNDFLDLIYQSVDDYFSDLNSIDVDNFFDEIVEYAEVDGISIGDLAKYEVNQIEDKYEVTGIIEIHVSLDGYVYWEKEYHNVDNTEITIEISFIYYQDEDGTEDFEITEFLV